MTNREYLQNLALIVVKSIGLSLGLMILHLIFIDLTLGNILDKYILQVTSIVFIVAPLVWGSYQLLVVQHRKAKDVLPHKVALAFVLAVPFSFLILTILRKKSQSQN